MKKLFFLFLLFTSLAHAQLPGPVYQGFTGKNYLDSLRILLGAGRKPIVSLDSGGYGQYLMSRGADSLPKWVSLASNAMLAIGDTVLSSANFAPLVVDGSHHLAQSSLVGTNGYVYTSNGTSSPPTFQNGALTYLSRTPNVSALNDVQANSTGVVPMALTTANNSDTNAFSIWSYYGIPFLTVDSGGGLNIYKNIGLWNGSSLDYGTPTKVLTSKGTGNTPQWTEKDSLTHGDQWHIQVGQGSTTAGFYQMPPALNGFQVVQSRPGLYPYATESPTLGAGGHVNGGSLTLNGFWSGGITLASADTTASYTVKMPPAQGAANTFLKNDGSGNLSWDVASGSLPSQSSGDTGKVLMTNGVSASWQYANDLLTGQTFQIGGLDFVTEQFMALYGATSHGQLTLYANDTSATYSLTFPPIQGSANTFLKNDGLGNLSWATASGGGVDTTYPYTWLNHHTWQIDGIGTLFTPAITLIDSTVGFLNSSPTLQFTSFDYLGTQADWLIKTSRNTSTSILEIASLYNNTPNGGITVSIAPTSSGFNFNGTNSNTYFSANSTTYDGTYADNYINFYNISTTHSFTLLPSSTTSNWSFTFPDSAGLPGQVLRTDGFGHGYWSDSTNSSGTANGLTRLTATGIDATVTGTTTIATPTSDFIVSMIIVRSVNVVGGTTDPFISVGTNAATYDNIMTDQQTIILSTGNNITNPVTTGGTTLTLNTFGLYVPSGTPILLNVQTGATATTMTIAIDIIGYYL